MNQLVLFLLSLLTEHMFPPLPSPSPPSPLSSISIQCLQKVSWSKSQVGRAGLVLGEHITVRYSGVWGGGGWGCLDVCGVSMCVHVCMCVKYVCAVCQLLDVIIMLTYSTVQWRVM